MGTHAIIRFKYKNEEYTTYRHFDGYPSTVLPDLKAFLEWNKSRNDDISYTVANYFYFMKKATKEESTGFGILPNNTFMDDVGAEYSYLVDLETLEVVQN